MEQNSQVRANGSDQAWELLESQIRQCYGRAVYTHKVHEKSADLYLSRLSVAKFIQIFLSALTTGGILGILFSDGSKLLAILTAIAATVQFFLNTYTKEYSLGSMVEKHASTAVKVWAVRENYLSLLSDISTRQITLEEARKNRERLQQELLGIYERAPRTNEKAYKAAQKALQLNEEMTFSDSEIDAFLPDILRRSD